METAAGEGVDGGTVLPSSSPPPLPSATPSPTDGSLDTYLSDADYFLSDANAVSTLAILCGSVRCPPFGRKPQDDESINIPEATGLGQVTTSPDISASDNDTGDANSTEKKLDENKSTQSRKMVPAMTASFAVFVFIVCGLVVWWLKRRKARRAATLSSQPPIFNGYNSNGSFSTFNSNGSSSSTAPLTHPPTQVQAQAPAISRYHSSGSLDALMSPFSPNTNLGHNGPHSHQYQQQHQHHHQHGHRPEMVQVTPPPPLPRRAQSDRHNQQQQQQQPERQFLAPPPPLPHRNRSHENLRRQVPAPPLPPRAHEYPPALPPRERSHTFSDIPADDLPPYVDPIEEAMAAVAAAENGADSLTQNSTSTSTTLSTSSGPAQSQPHSRPQQPPPYNTIAFNVPAQ